jgi:fructokinase
LPGDSFAGTCPFHGDCLEGMAAGPAVAARTGRQPAEVPPDDPVWDLVARYLAFGLCSVVLTLAPRRVILGGGLLRQPGLLPRIQRALVDWLHGYLPVPEVEARIDDYLVASPLDQKAGLYGALVLAERAGRGDEG